MSCDKVEAHGPQEPSRVLFRYHGGKWRIADWVISHFPAHRVYLEPFGGGGSVLARKPRSRTEIYNDLDGEIVNVFRILRDAEQSKALASLIALTPFSRDEYESAYEDCFEQIERARRTLVKGYFAMSSKGIFEKSGFDGRVNPDAFASRVRSFANLPETIIQWATRFRAVIVENTDAVKLIKIYGRRKDALIYADPPYVWQARSGKMYNREMADDDHRALADALNGCTCPVVVSGYRSKLYDEIFSGWETREIPARADNAAARTEVLWMKNMPRELFTFEASIGC